MQLLDAIRTDALDVLASHIQLDPSWLEYEDEQGANLLSIALKERASNEVLHQLIALGLDVQHYDDEGVSVLEYAITYGNTQFAQFLIDTYVINPSVTMRRSGFTPLMAAVCYNHTELVEHFVSLGVNMQARDQSGFSAADYARRMHKKRIAKLLDPKGE